METHVSGIAREGKIDPELAAYLYIARLRSSPGPRRRKAEMTGGAVTRIRGQL